MHRYSGSVRTLKGRVRVRVRVRDRVRTRVRLGPSGVESTRGHMHSESHHAIDMSNMRAQGYVENIEYASALHPPLEYVIALHTCQGYVEKSAATSHRLGLG